MQSKWKRVDKVLSFLDGEADEFRIPRLGINAATGDVTAGVCLHVFGSDKTFLLTFEQSAYCTQQQAFANIINGVSPERSVVKLRCPFLTEQFEMVWHKGKFLLDPYDVRIRVNDVERRFQFSDHDYRDLGVDLHNPPADLYDPGEINIAVYVLRLLGRELGSEIYAAPGEMLAKCDMTNHGLRHLLTLREYYHPPLPKMPSETETFRMIADVIVSGDASRYRPSEPPNTRWMDLPFDKMRN